ncbi:hypothetical protein QQY66_35190 [Streptomyces sp. DG2A-72]|uniref:hypothetical protein n=1 Tax=Streptomyces sp. DG2A-72 TaxID=3051386 RepID=UPI00265BCB32|nr:hypothetical protein [Streptomyces sp. DG2A-72]MDO0936705.1 hypothetical protein [Streptomyces sp. DG2A-72]
MPPVVLLGFNLRCDPAAKSEGQGWETSNKDGSSNVRAASRQEGTPETTKLLPDGSNIQV